jgi:hypothetical protein
MNRAVITLQEYQGFQRAYDFFNIELFGGSLPQVLVTLQRHANTRGYFSPERFKGRVEKAAVHELALNPDTFTGRTDEMILSTLVHEMCHVWQETYGGKRSRGYHGGTNLTQVGRKADRAHIAVEASVVAAQRITSSARKRSVGGIVRPSALAVLRLMTSSNFQGCSTGRSAGLAPFKILSTYTVVWR